jgi:hypothetical protein
MEVYFIHPSLLILNHFPKMPSLKTAKSMQLPTIVNCCFSDVYVVEIAHQDLIRHAESSPPVQVYLQGEKARSVPRNITLFLKAHRPTRWQLISHGIDGKIVVIVS